MPTGVWRRRPPQPPPAGLTVVCPIGTATPAEAERYREGRPHEEGRTVTDQDQPVMRVTAVTPEAQEQLALALEEAALHVRQSIPAGFEWDVNDDIDWIWVGPTERMPGMRSPLRRRFDIGW